MGIAPYKTFTFDGESSADYGIYITGEGVFNAPERAVEMVEIPNRNGAFALDKGRFENIEVTYRIGLFDEAESDFADKVSAFRNWICSKVGYCRLEDEYNPDEYRMAVYKEGVKLEHDFLIAGEAEITFDCKPQRWLKSGESAVSVTSGDTLTNPTRFDASPLLEVEGYGMIDLGGQEITIDNVFIGEIVIFGGGTSNSVVLDESNLNNGDTIIVNTSNNKSNIILTANNAGYLVSIHRTTGNFSCTNSDFSAKPNGWEKQSSQRYYLYVSTSGSFSIVAGTNSTVTNTVSGTLHVNGNPNSADITFSYTETFTYTASTHTITYATSNATVSSSEAWIKSLSFGSGTAHYSEILGDSTKSALGHPTYIDLDIGEAYITDYGEPTSVNNTVNLGSDLPTIPTGTTAITYDNTITDLKIAARWWKV